MNQSENIGDLALELSVCQGNADRFGEAILIKKMNDLPQFKKNFLKGNFKNKNFVERFYEKLSFGLSDCWFWIAHINEHGYGKMSDVLAHRTSWIIHKGEIPIGMQVLHKCDVRSCVNPDHLFIGNQNDNMKDMAKKNRGKNRINGELNLQHKLTESDVLEIRELYKSLKDEKKLAEKFNVNRTTIYKIIKRQTWRHI